MENRHDVESFDSLNGRRRQQRPAQIIFPDVHMQQMKFWTSSIENNHFYGHLQMPRIFIHNKLLLHTQNIPKSKRTHFHSFKQRISGQWADT